MLKYITVISLLIIGCGSADEPSGNIVTQPTEDTTEFSGLLLPEHRDTTTVFNVRPDSLFEGIRYDSIVSYGANDYVFTTFDHLAKVTFTEGLSSEGFLYLHPHFSREVYSLDDQPVAITGYLVPISHASNFYALSANPYQACFFCGGAGPESVIELRFTGDPALPSGTDRIITVGGTLHLNSTDWYELCYVLKDAVLLNIH